MLERYDSLVDTSTSLDQDFPASNLIEAPVYQQSVTIDSEKYYFEKFSQPSLWSRKKNWSSHSHRNQHADYCTILLPRTIVVSYVIAYCFDTGREKKQRKKRIHLFIFIVREGQEVLFTGTKSAIHRSFVASIPPIDPIIITESQKFSIYRFSCRDKQGKAISRFGNLVLPTICHELWNRNENSVKNNYYA